MVQLSQAALNPKICIDQVVCSNRILRTHPLSGQSCLAKKHLAKIGHRHESGLRSINNLSEEGKIYVTATPEARCFLVVLMDFPASVSGKHVPIQPILLTSSSVSYLVSSVVHSLSLQRPSLAIWTGLDARRATVAIE